MKPFVTAAALMLLAACAKKEEGQLYLDAVSAAIRASDRIVVTEHSSEVDFLDPDGPNEVFPGPFVYRAVELNQEQKEMFSSVIGGLNPKTQDAFPACIFEGHHTIHFYAGEKLTSKMEICFHGELGSRGAGVRSCSATIPIRPVRIADAQDLTPLLRFLKVSQQSSHNGTPADEVVDAIFPALKRDNRKRIAAIFTWTDTYSGIPHTPTNTRLQSRVKLSSILDVLKAFHGLYVRRISQISERIETSIELFTLKSQGNARENPTLSAEVVAHR